jgi:hypothetical protein
MKTMASLFEEMGGTYTLGADGMYYPNLELPEEETPRYGKYGRMRHTYLREHKKAYYTTLLFDGKLVAHLNEIDDAANTQMQLITKQMAKTQGITEALKAKDQMAWVGAMNNIRNVAEEIILNELIYS